MMDTTVLAAFLEYSPNPTWLADSDGRCVYANQALREISAISADQLGDLNWLELVTDEDRDISWKKLVPNILEDQKSIWSFPHKLSERSNLIPAVAFVAAGTALFTFGLP